MSSNETQYCAQRLATRISKPSVFSSLDKQFTLRLPYMVGSDIMHLGALNLSDLIISLWHGTITYAMPDERST